MSAGRINKRIKSESLFIAFETTGCRVSNPFGFGINRERKVDNENSGEDNTSSRKEKNFTVSKPMGPDWEKVCSFPD